MEKNKLSANIMLVLTAMIWGFAFVAQKSATIAPFTFNAIRFLIGSLSLIPVILIFESKGIRDKQKVSNTIKYGIITGCVLFIASNLQHFGIVAITQASKAGFITGTYTVIVPIFGIFLGKKTNINAWMGAILAVCGLYLISVVGTPILEFGDLLLLISAFFWAAHIMVIDRFVDRVNPIMYSSVQFLTVSVISLFAMLMFEIPDFSLASLYASTINILYAGIMSSGVAYTLQVVGQKNSDPTAAAIIFSSESVFCAIGCVLLLGDKMSVASIFGCVLIFAGIILSQINIKNKQ